jgi:hypothetical protein
MKKSILIVEDNALSLPVHIVDTIEDAAAWIGCSIKTLYNTMHLYGSMKAKGYVLELVNEDEAEGME